MPTLCRPGRTGAVTAVDLSGEAIAQAQARYGPLARFLVADVAKWLPFADASFDAVMSNVAAERLGRHARHLPRARRLGAAQPALALGQSLRTAP